MGQTSWVSETTLALPGREAELHAVPLASDNTPAEELVVSSAKHGTAVLGQVSDPIELSPPGTVSFFHVDPPAAEHVDPAVVLQ